MIRVDGNLQAILIAGARIELKGVQLREDVLLDELYLDGIDIRLETGPDGSEGQLSTGETKVRAMMSEANLNRMVSANLPPDSPVRNVHIALLSGRARISGKVMLTFVPIPFSIDAAPRVENGVRVSLECRTATCGVDLPRAAVEVIQQRLNDALGLNLEQIDIPIWIDEIRCEPGRLTAVGRARITWPPHAPMVLPHRGEPKFDSAIFAASAPQIAGDLEAGRPRAADAPDDNTRTVA